MLKGSGIFGEQNKSIINLSQVYFLLWTLSEIISVMCVEHNAKHIECAQLMIANPINDYM